MRFSIFIDVAVVSVIWITAIMGYKRGLIRTIYGLSAFVLAAVATALCYEYVAEYLMSLPFMQGLIDNMNKSIAESIVTNTDVNSFMPIWMKDTVAGAVQNAGITIAGKLVEIIIMIATIVITFFIAKILLSLLIGILDALMKLPLLDTINRTGGLLVGIIKGVLIALICFGVVSMFVTVEKYQHIHNLINETYLAKYFYNNNILMRLIMK